MAAIWVYLGVFSKLCTLCETLGVRGILLWHEAAPSTRAIPLGVYPVVSYNVSLSVSLKGRLQGPAALG